MNTDAKPNEATPAAPSPFSPGRELTKARWRQSLGAARLAWGKLTDEELPQVDGRADRLAGLVKERYLISREAALQQVREFYARHLA